MSKPGNKKPRGGSKKPPVKQSTTPPVEPTRDVGGSSPGGPQKNRSSTGATLGHEDTSRSTTQPPTQRTPRSPSQRSKSPSDSGDSSADNSHHSDEVDTSSSDSPAPDDSSEDEVGQSVLRDLPPPKTGKSSKSSTKSTTSSRSHQSKASKASETPYIDPPSEALDKREEQDSASEVEVPQASPKDLPPPKTRNSSRSSTTKSTTTRREPPPNVPKPSEPIAIDPPSEALDSTEGQVGESLDDSSSRSAGPRDIYARVHNHFATRLTQTEVLLLKLTEKSKPAFERWEDRLRGKFSLLHETYACGYDSKRLGLYNQPRIDLASILLDRDLQRSLEIHLRARYSQARGDFASAPPDLYPSSRLLMMEGCNVTLNLEQEQICVTQDLRIFVDAVGDLMRMICKELSTSVRSKATLPMMMADIEATRCDFWTAEDGSALDVWDNKIVKILSENEELAKSISLEHFRESVFPAVINACLLPREFTKRRLPIYQLITFLRSDPNIVDFMSLRVAIKMVSNMLIQRARFALEMGYLPPSPVPHIAKRLIDFDNAEEESMTETAASNRSTKKKAKSQSPTEAKAKSPFRPDTKETKTLCYGCGHAGHKSHECQKRLHVDWNKEKGVPWEDSTNGKAYKALNLSRLSQKLKLDGRGGTEPYTMPTADNKGKLAVMNPNDILLPMSLLKSNRKAQEVKVLLDSGAAEDDYVSAKLVKTLQLQLSKSNDAYVCPINRPCSISSNRCVITLRTSDELSNSPFHFTLNYVVTPDLDDLPFDVIVGKRSMDALKLASVVPSFFALDKDVILSMAQKVLTREGKTPASDTFSNVPEAPVDTFPSATACNARSTAKSKDKAKDTIRSKTHRDSGRHTSSEHPSTVQTLAVPSSNERTSEACEPACCKTIEHDSDGITLHSSSSHCTRCLSTATIATSSAIESPTSALHNVINEHSLNDTKPEDTHVRATQPDELTLSQEQLADVEQFITCHTVRYDNVAVTSHSNGRFKNCTIASLSNGIVRRVSDKITLEKADDYFTEDGNTTDESFEEELPPGVDSEDMQAPSTESNLPKMVCNDPALRAQIADLCLRYVDIFSRNMQANPAKLPPLKLEVDTAKWYAFRNRLPPRDMNTVKQKAVLETVQTMLATGLIKPTQAQAWSQVVLAKKPDGTWRFCVDYRTLNDCLTALGWRIPNIRQLFQRLGSRRAKYFAVVDLTKGYWQIALAADSQQFAAFTTTTGTYAPTRVWMGLKSAGSYFQEQISQRVLGGDLIYNGCEVYIDDVIIYGATAEEFMKNLTAVFARFRQYGITLHPDKCVLGVNEIEYVGHVVNEFGITMSEAKIRSVLDFPLPNKQKELRSFLGLVNYFRDHVNRHSTVVGPMYDVLQQVGNHRHLIWSPAAKTAFTTIKALIEKCPTLFFVDETAPITLQTDASDYGLGGYLYQTINGQQQPIVFLSKAFSKAQLRWSTFEKEAYAIIFCIRKLDYLLRDIHFTLQTDHRNLMFLKEESNPKVVRWNMVIAEYNYTLQHIPGETNVIADAMSRLVHNPKTDVERDHQQLKPSPKQTNISALVRNIDIPNDKYAILERFHNSQVGHFGYEHTVRTLHQNHHDWKYLRSHVKKFIRDCPMCQKMNPIVENVSAIRFTTAAYEPFARISLDTIGPLPESDDGYKFILVIIDCFTRIVELYPCRSTEADEAAQYLIEFISRYGTPEQLISDRGTQFVNAVIAAALTQLGAEHILSLANSKQELAIVERANKEVMRFIIPLVYESKDLGKWPRYLPLVRRILVTHPHDSTKVAPATLLYGSMVQLERGIFPEGNLPSTDSTPSSRTTNRLDPSWINEMREAQLTLLDVAQRHQKQLDAEHLAERTERSPPITEFTVGSYVLAVYRDRHSHGKGRPPHKLMTIKQGPYRVVGHEDNTYRVQHLAHDNVMEFHVTELQPFVYDPARTDPFQVALGDNQEFVVEQVIRHELRDNPHGHKRKHLYLLIKWEGFDETYDSWEPVTTQYHLPLVRDYLTANKLTAYIPASFKHQPEKNLKPRRPRQQR